MSSSRLYNFTAEGFQRRAVLQRVNAIGSSSFSAFSINYEYFFAFYVHFRAVSQRYFFHFSSSGSVSSGSGFSSRSSSVFSLSLERNVGRSSSNYESSGSNHHVLLHILFPLNIINALRNTQQSVSNMLFLKVFSRGVAPS